MYFRYNKNETITYLIALYIRLSREDGDDMESESVSNQRSMLLGYLKANNLVAVETYIDDGYSGGNFNRPAFQKMMKDVESGKINCIITKDLSRLGRDHIDTGHYIERYFPEHNIRYIAINDDIDTFYETSASDMMPFKLSMNDMYAKDISKKVRSSLITMKQEGKFCGSVPSYGYKRDPENKYQLIIDPETAPIVKEIFNLYISGYSSCQIADILTREEVPTPVLLKNRTTRQKNCFHPDIWKHSSVNNILKNRVYTGCLIQHKTQNVSYKSKKRKDIPESEWCVFENTHEPIITKKTYQLAQTIRNKSNTYSPTRRNIEYILSGLVYCKDCGAKMSISYDQKRNRTTMNCNTYRKYSKYNYCFSHYINYDKLENTIYSKLSLLSLHYYKDKNEFEKIIKEEYNDPEQELQRKCDKVENSLKKLQAKQDSLYDDKFNSIITTETYQRLFNNCENEKKELKTKLDKYKMQLKSIKKESIEFIDYMKIVDDFLKMRNPTKEMINKLIKRINITKDGKVEIYYNFSNIKED